MTRLFFFLFLFPFLSFLGFGAVQAQSVEDLADRVVLVEEAPPSKAGETAYRSVPFEAPATGVVVRGRSLDRNLRGQVRFVEDDETGRWRDLHIVFSATGPTFMAGFYGADVIERGRFELRFEGELTLEGAGVFDNRRDPDRAPDEAPPTLNEPSRKRVGDIIAPRMISREEWGAKPFVGDPVALARPNYIYLTFHHAAGFGARTIDEGKQQVFNIQDFHQNGRGWSDIGYQFVMDKGGHIYQGRPFLNGPAPLSSAPPLVLGAHVGGHNTGNIGICALGCYHPPAGTTCEDVLSNAAIDSLAVMLAFLSENYGVSPDRLRGHRDFSATACPGDNNYALIDDLRERIKLLLTTGNQPIGAVAMTAETDDNAVVHLEWQFIENNGIARYRIEREYAGGSEVIFESTDISDAQLVDARTDLPGPVVYRLYGVNAQGREQLLGIAEANVANPEQYVLTETFPNPFSSSTTIRYYLPQDGIVRLAVYDMLGREVEVLASHPQDGGRWSYAEFDAAGLAAGTYLYRLTVEGFSGTVFKESRSLIVVR